MKFKYNKKVFYISLLIFVLLIGSFMIYNIVGKADTDSNKIAIKEATITGIDTGGNSSSFDGFNYNDKASYSKIEGYIAGEDSNSQNRIVRSFDTLTYHLNFSIDSKKGTSDYEERKVTVKVILPESITKYVAFDMDSIGGKCNNNLNESSSECTYTFDGIDSYGNFQKDITLYVLGAPNGTTISPKFEIQESTNTDPEYLVTLGNVSSDSYNYKYDREKNQNYSNTPTEQGFLNYMPTVVSSKTPKLRFKILGQTNEGQKATYKDKIGRYLTYVIGLELVGDDINGIKGYTMPDGSDILFDLTMSQNGSVKTLETSSDWIRLYGMNSVSSIEPVIVNMPYSDSNVNLSKRTKEPGSFNLSNTSGKISGYNVTYSKVTINADGSSINNSEHFIGTYAISVFSERSLSDAKNDITTTMSISGSAKDTSGENLKIDSVSASLVNKYYEDTDYSLTGAFYDEAGNKLSSDSNGKGSVSKGTSLVYRTTFNYKKTLSTQGLKEIIKIDPNAYRVMPLGDNDIKITVNAPNGSELSKDDFEVKFASGDYSNLNYSANFTFNKVTNEDLSSVQTACQLVSRNLKNYTSDQIMNLYGGPCITGKNEQQFEKVSSAKKGETEIPITKIIVQTKKGVVLPNSAVVTVEIGLRVRNISDLTSTYQVTTVATSSDYDQNITYYAPRVTDDENSITNPNNYKKTIYQGTNIVSIDKDSTWGDSLKIVNFTSRQEITVTNKNKDGTVKTNYNLNKSETLSYNIKTIINDDNQIVGVDDVWWINNLKVYVNLPSSLTYLAYNDLGTPEVQMLSDGSTLLIYTLSYTKPNQKIKDINFKAIINPTLKGNAVPITVSSRVEAINVNGEKDTSYFGYLTGDFTIYATGIENVIVSQKVGSEGSVVEKDSEFSYLISAYNNTSMDITDYSIVDILPSNNDINGSKFKGSYKVKIDIPSSLGSAKVYCSTQNYSKLTNEVFNNNNEFKECNVNYEYEEITAIKITNISILKNTNMEYIKVYIKPSSNDYSDKYVNSFVGGSKTYSQNESNKIGVRVISRNISGRVFIDNNEDGMENIEDTYLSDIPVTLYKLNSENNMTKIEDTVTSKDGYYEFKDLAVGRYKIRANYDKDNYDLTLRYATENRTIDSDAYKIDEGIVEISNYRNPDESDGIKVTRDIESVSDMNIGLIRTKSFGFNVNKYITKADLTYNGATITKDYPNLKLVKEEFKNSYRASVKVYYGIKIENNSNTAGYVKLINESIPEGSIFDPTDPVNSGWINNNGTLQNVSLQDDIINPGESRYVAVALNIPPKEQGKSYVNTVSIQIERHDKEEKLVEDINVNSNKYEVGEAVNYAGVSFHVIGVVNVNDNEQVLTLLADSNNKNKKMGHTTSTSSIYKWSDSLINKYINEEYLSTNTLNKSILIDSSVCDDASGMPIASYGGTLQKEGTCQSGIYNVYKIRLLTEEEYKELFNETNKAWLYGNNDFWLMNSVFEKQTTDVYGKVTNDSTNLAKYVNKDGTTISNASSNLNKEVRPVITISNKNIIPE